MNKPSAPPPPASGEVGEHRWIWPDHMLRAPSPAPTQGEEEVDAAVKIYRDTAAAFQGFLYGHRHVIRDLRRPPHEQEVWSLTEENGDELGLGLDYERCHQAMMDELDRIAMRAAIRARIGKEIGA